MSADVAAASSQPGDPTDVTWVRGNDRVARMLEKPGMREAVAARQAQMREADRGYAMGLAALRKAAELTQTDLATSLGISQAAVAKTEQRQDLLLSTLSAYLEALGGQARVVVSFDGGQEVEVDLAALHRGSTPA